MKGSTVAVACVMALGTSAARADVREALSPGPLSKAHQSLDKTCDACHVERQGSPDERCLRCHTRRGSQRKGRRGTHAAFGAQPCASCHQEHRGADHSATPPVNPATFDHASTGFRLEGEHRTADCGSCHKPSPTGLQWTFVSTTCVGCPPTPTTAARWVGAPAATPARRGASFASITMTPRWATRRRASTPPWSAGGATPKRARSAERPGAASGATAGFRAASSCRPPTPASSATPTATGGSSRRGPSAAPRPLAPPATVARVTPPLAGARPPSTSPASRASRCRCAAPTGTWPAPAAISPTPRG